MRNVNVNIKNRLYLEQPFWGMRGRRESSEEILSDLDNKHLTTGCKTCFKSLNDDTVSGEEILSPFWGNRGRRNSDEVDEDFAIPENPFWGTRGRREEDEPFWGTRGRREQELPFWGNRGRREGIQLKNEKSGKKKTLANAKPFWGNRGNKKYVEAIINAIEEDEPFWGNRGKKEVTEPFWGSRGRRKDISNEINKQPDLFWENDGINKAVPTDTTSKPLNGVEDGVITFSRLQRNDKTKIPFWWNREPNSKILNLFSGIIDNKLHRRFNSMDSTNNFDLPFKPSESETVLDDRIFAEQPHYILVERSSRSSAESDPYYISRGKKHSDQSYAKTRGRRGVIEELVKSVRNDPYYIARGKKNYDINSNTIPRDKFEKMVDLICSTVDLLPLKGKSNKVKRDINDTERDRRTTLKKLAAQLQADPYFVSRGKKNKVVGTTKGNMEDFIKQVAAMCD
ncbi:uncharacterized protein natalisin [Battus philenor]|uniref:uncharacterized protein natalisin n=1 Tax=Battus philenor TaxID=42288 RepID=UPI0035D0A1EE